LGGSISKLCLTAPAQILAAAAWQGAV